ARRAGARGAAQLSPDLADARARQDQSGAHAAGAAHRGRNRRTPAARTRSARPMRFAYYPGCSARSTCAELNAATHRVAARLGLDLLQLDSATCTGARELRAIDP